MEINKEIEKKYFFAISIPTRNRSEFLKSGIINQLPKLKKLNIGVYIFDNSDDELTKKLINSYLDKYSNVFYLKNKEVLTYGENTSQAFLVPNTKYLVVMGDSLILDIDYLSEIIEILKNKNPDFLILNSRVKSQKSKEYIDKLEFFKELTWHCTLIGSTIFNSELIKIGKEKGIFLKYEKSDFIQLGILFESLNYKKEIYGIFLSKLLLKANSLKKTSYWKKNTFDIFGYKWIQFIENLPNVYDRYKKEVILSHGIKSNLFTLRGFLNLRLENGFGINEYRKYKNIFYQITDINRIIILLISIIPIFILKILKKTYQLMKGMKKL
ncbi:glycosyltransferase family A protein [uncultured Fusobacterium sp.]|uniref:glycosyltransferase family A protein n=1 Tax=uncultured Fusobacterium sp. TaxID=159267 RepID=UPI00266020C0|nr:glycosyltransferase family A protein [uncultured Fusobacterium sp.]